MAGLDSLEKIIEVGKVSKAVRGGITYSYFAFAVVGYRDGRVGYGRGKASDVQSARAKAIAKALKSLVTISLDSAGDIHHDVDGRNKCSIVFVKKRAKGSGIIANDKLRAVFECAGITNVNVKLIGTGNTATMIIACINALKKLGSAKFCSIKS